MTVFGQVNLVYFRFYSRLIFLVAFLLNLVSLVTCLFISMNLLFLIIENFSSIK